MITIAICDDEKTVRTYLAALIQAQHLPCQVVEYASAAECLADSRRIDLIFLDIALPAPGPDGMALARRLREQGESPVIVFVSGHGEYVYDAFDVGAFHYLLKPIDEEKFSRVLARAAEQAQAGHAQSGQEKGRALTLQATGTTRTIPLSSIRYIESSNHKVVLHLHGGEFTCYAKIGALEQELGEQFFRIHKGYLVNLSYVDGYTRAEVEMANGDRLLLSKYKYQDFVKAYLRFLKRGAGL